MEASRRYREEQRAQREEVRVRERRSEAGETTSLPVSSTRLMCLNVLLSCASGPHRCVPRRRLKRRPVRPRSRRRSRRARTCPRRRPPPRRRPRRPWPAERCVLLSIRVHSCTLHGIVSHIGASLVVHISGAVCPTPVLSCPQCLAGTGAYPRPALIREMNESEVEEYEASLRQVPLRYRIALH